MNRTGVLIRLVYAEGDIGLRHLRQRFGRRVARLQAAGTILVEEVPGIDHQMHREWLRPEVLRRLLELIQEIDRASP